MTASGETLFSDQKELMDYMIMSYINCQSIIITTLLLVWTTVSLEVPALVHTRLRDDSVL